MFNLVRNYESLKKSIQKIVVRDLYWMIVYVFFRIFIDKVWFWYPFRLSDLLIMGPNKDLY